MLIVAVVTSDLVRQNFPGGRSIDALTVTGKYAKMAEQVSQCIKLPSPIINVERCSTEKS